MSTRILELEAALERERGVAAKAAAAAAAAAASGGGRFEDFVKRRQKEGERGGAAVPDAGSSDLRALYEEELAVARDAISNLRTSFK